MKNDHVRHVLSQDLGSRKSCAKTVSKYLTDDWFDECSKHDLTIQTATLD